MQHDSGSVPEWNAAAVCSLPFLRSTNVPSQKLTIGYCFSRRRCSTMEVKTRMFHPPECKKEEIF